LGFAAACLWARVAAAFFAAALRTRVFAAFLPAARCLRVAAAFFPAALRFLGLAAFLPADFLFGLIRSSLPLRLIQFGQVRRENFPPPHSIRRKLPEFPGVKLSIAQNLEQGCCASIAQKSRQFLGSVRPAFWRAKKNPALSTEGATLVLTKKIWG
jgi:hypothetical protein